MLVSYYKFVLNFTKNYTLHTIQFILKADKNICAENRNFIINNIQNKRKARENFSRILNIILWVR